MKYVYFAIVIMLLLPSKSFSNDLTIDHLYLLASSTLEENSYLEKYSVMNIFSKNNDSSWAEGMDDNGIGEFIFIYFNPNSYDPNSYKHKYYDIDQIKIKNGFTKNDSLYSSNNRINKLRIQIENETSENTTSCYSFTVNLKDNCLDYQNINIPEDYSKNISEIVLIIDSVYKGSKFNDTCISKIDFYSMNDKYNIKQISYSSAYSPFDKYTKENLFYETINSTGASWAELISLNKDNDFEKYSKNGFIVFDKKYCYINDNEGLKIKSKQGYKYKYQYIFIKDRLYFFKNSNWNPISYKVHYFLGNSYTGDCPKIGFSLDTEIIFNFEELHGKFKSYYSSDNPSKNQERLGALMKQIIPFN